MIIQLLIAAMSLTATYLSLAKSDNVRRWAPIFGLGVQPLWMITTFQHEQWGMFGLCFVYSSIWLNNARRYWTPRALWRSWYEWRYRNTPADSCVCGRENPSECSLMICVRSGTRTQMINQKVINRMTK